jgi:hypothetical protein
VRVQKNLRANNGHTEGRLLAQVQYVLSSLKKRIVSVGTSSQKRILILTFSSMVFASAVDVEIYKYNEPNNAKSSKKWRALYEVALYVPRLSLLGLCPRNALS